MTNDNQPHEPVARSHGTPRELGADVLRVLTTYVRGQLLIALILSVLYAIGFAILAVPWWFFFAIFCGLLSLIPNFGTPIGMIFTLFIVWVEGADFTRVLLVTGVFVAVMAMEGYVLTPRIQGRRLGLSPLLVFFGALAGGLMFGFFGLLLAVPVLAVLNVIWRHYRSSRLT